MGHAIDLRPLRLDAATFRTLLARLGPSLGLWRAAEIAALREADVRRPVLDLGCGDGIVTALAFGSVEVGVDPSTEAATAARSSGAYRRVVAATIQEADLPDHGFSTIISNSVLEHVEDLDAALSAAAARLRPGGRLVMTAPTEQFSRSLALPGRAYARARNRRLDHLNLLGLDAWRGRLARAGLVVERVRPYLRGSLVRAWDALELAQLVRVRGVRPFGRAWRRLPPAALDRLARRAARVDLSSPYPGGGRLIVARRT